MIATTTLTAIPNDIAYRGPYLVTNATAENTIVSEASLSYWNEDNIRLTKIVWKYNDGKAGVIDGVALNSAATVSCNIS